MNYATAEAKDNREKILKFIVKYIKRHCYPPATYEIAADTGLSKATVRRHIAMLLEDRILETEHPGDSRAYRIKDTKIVMVKEKKTNGNELTPHSVCNKNETGGARPSRNRFKRRM